MSKKDVGLRIRVDRGLREAFLDACKAEERHASEVLRDFMRHYAEQHSGAQGQMKLPLGKNQNREGI